MLQLNAPKFKGSISPDSSMNSNFTYIYIYKRSKIPGEAYNTARVSSLRSKLAKVYISAKIAPQTLQQVASAKRERERERSESPLECKDTDVIYKYTWI